MLVHVSGDLRLVLLHSLSTLIVTLTPLLHSPTQSPLTHPPNHPPTHPQIMFWTCQAPISVVSLNVVPPHLRARSQGVLIFLQHVLGDIISPPMIGEGWGGWVGCGMTFRLCV
jgi:hypothetical protein